MAIARAPRVASKQLIQEMKELILRHFPDASFEVERRKADEFILHVTANFDDNAPDAGEITAERSVDFLEDHDVWIIVLSHDRKQVEAMGIS